MYDLIIRNGMVVDGSGNKPFTGDVAIKDGIIKSLKASEGRAIREIDGQGKYVTPGFVDIHRHCDLKMLSPDFGEVELRQGITTVLAGNCGMSAAPASKEYFDDLNNYLEPLLGKNRGGRFPLFSDYIEKAQSLKIKTGYGALLGNGTVRIAVKGFDPSPMSDYEMDKALSYVEDAMENGAMGISLGLMYAPENFYSFDELASILKTVGKYNKFFAIHVRGEGNSLVPSVKEAIRLGEKAGIPVHISHFKAAGRGSWKSLIYQAIEEIDLNRSRGMDITCDVYPYNAGSTLLSTLLPPSVLKGGMGNMIRILSDRDLRKKIKEDLLVKHDDWDNLMVDLGWENVVISSVASEKNKCFTGMTMAEIAKSSGEDVIDVMADLLIEEEGKVSIVIFHMLEDDMKEVIKLDYSMIASDSLYADSGNAHPRLYGTFPRILEKFVKQEKFLSIERAVEKMTSMPAKRAGFSQRGLIKEGYYADINVFDGDKIKETTTYVNPASLAVGFDYVIKDGNIVIEDDVLKIP